MPYFPLISPIMAECGRAIFQCKSNADVPLSTVAFMALVVCLVAAGFGSEGRGEG